MYEAITRAISVTVEASFEEERSLPDEGLFFWAYTVEIDNQGEEPVQLRARHWRITDANGMTREVRGAGVVGKEPVLAPGETFSYTSGAPLTTSSGFMTGSYQMESASGERFDVSIPTFSLDSPYVHQTVN